MIIFVSLIPNMNYVKIQNYYSPLGDLILGSFENKLCLCDWFHRTNRMAIDTRLRKGLNAEFSEEKDQIIETAVFQLEEYFKGKRRIFELPLLLIGTDFQKKVWQALLEIPYGKTETYASLSERLNNPLGIRAIASANGANALSILVPCHRVIGSDGKMVGYAGGLRTKKKLLQLEGALNSSQLELF
jgi:methylated-DNA-[protein]-cysteine S-methyltransferase